MKKLIITVITLIAFNVNAGKLADTVKAAGYKGIRTGGVANFLYSVKHGDNIKSGKNWVFWSDINDKSKEQDVLFEAVQIVDGYTIYDLTKYLTKETIEFTIAVPGGDVDSFMQYQTLRHRCHSFEGNLQFTTGTGSTQIIPEFKPVDKTICPG